MAMAIHSRELQAHMQRLEVFGTNKQTQVNEQTDPVIKHNIQFLWNRFKLGSPAWDVGLGVDLSGRLQLISSAQQAMPEPGRVPGFALRVINFFRKIIESIRTWVVSWFGMSQPNTENTQQTPEFRLNQALENAVGVDGLKYLFYGSIFPQMTALLATQSGGLGAFTNSDIGKFLKFLYFLDGLCFGRWESMQHGEPLEQAYSYPMNIEALYRRYIAKSDGNLLPIWVREKDDTIDNLYPQF